MPLDDAVEGIVWEFDGLGDLDKLLGGGVQVAHFQHLFKGHGVDVSLKSLDILVLLLDDAKPESRAGVHRIG